MAKESTARLMVYVGIGLVIAGAVFSAFVVIPRMELHPESIDSVPSAWFFCAIIPLIVAAFLLACFIQNRHNLERIGCVLILGEVLIILLSLAIAFISLSIPLSGSIRPMNRTTSCPFSFKLLRALLLPMFLNSSRFTPQGTTEIFSSAAS